MNSRGIYFGVLSNVFGNLLMLGATIWLTRILSPKEFGEFRVGSNFSTLIVPFLALGGERLVSRLIQRDKSNDILISKAIGSMIVFTSFGVMILACTYPFLSKYVFEGNVSIWVYAGSVMLVPLTIAYNLGNTIWRHIGSPASAQVHLNFTQRLLRAPLLIGATLIWPTAIASTLAMCSAQAVSLVQIRKNLLYYPLAKMDSVVSALRESAGTLLTIGVPVALMASVDRLDVLLINNVMGVEKAGVYDLVFMLSLTAMFPAMAMSKTAEPFLFSLANDRERKDRIKRLQTKSFILSCVAVLGVIVLSPLISGFLKNTGSDFSNAAVILSAGLAFSSAHGPVLEYMQINGKAKLTILVVMILMLIFFALKYIAALTGSLVWIASLAGLFYFTLRLTLAIYIHVTDKVVMAYAPITILSLFGYAFAAAYVWMPSLPS